MAEHVFGCDSCFGRVGAVVLSMWIWLNVGEQVAPKMAISFLLVNHPILRVRLFEPYQ